jgi:hypothetical protein
MHGVAVRSSRTRRPEILHPAHACRSYTNSRKTPTFTVMGPDNIPIRREPFASREAAERGIVEFVARFRLQGYYAGVGYRLAIEDIARHCRIEVSSE